VEAFQYFQLKLIHYKVTNHFADDVDPSVSNDGELMGFLSTRPGPAMIYTLDPRGVEKNVKRVSYVGQFNATPRFNPHGTEMAFVSWVDNRFDVYRISRDGTQLVRLTKNFGSNEEPSYSKDGQFIVFTSQRVLSKFKAIQNLYIMTRDGEILGNITHQFGNCLTPRWSN
jgi:TolB protein